MSRSSRPAVSRALRGAAAITTGLAVVVAPVAVFTTAAAATAPAPAPKFCKSGVLPADVNGRSAALSAGLPAGAWVWHDTKGFHLRVTHDAKTKLAFTGSIVSSGNLSAHLLRAERDDVIWRNSHNNAVRFALHNHGGIDGIDFKAGCAKKLTITLNAAGQKLTTARIFLGSDAVNPAANPVVIVRTVVVPPAPCSTGVLPGEVNGRSASFKAGLPAGAWVWHDTTGFHLRVTHDSKSKVTFSGSVVSSNKIRAHLIRAERNDVLWRNSNNTAIRFTLRNYGGVDGVDFRVGCAKKVTLNLRVAGHSMTTLQIHLGIADANPVSNPVTIERTVPVPVPVG